MENELKQFGFRAREAREALKLSREDVAALLNINFRTLGKWENGLSDPPLTKVLELAKVLKMPVEKLLGLEAAQTKDSFNNAQQEHSYILNDSTISFDQKLVDEFGRRFDFLEKLVLALQDEKILLLKDK